MCRNSSKLKAQSEELGVEKMQPAYKELTVWKRAVNFAVALIDTVEGDFNGPETLSPAGTN